MKSIGSKSTDLSVRMVWCGSGKRVEYPDRREEVVDEALDHLHRARKRAAPLGWPAHELRIKEAAGDYTPGM